jgi:phosphoribosyl 1,2-cyclic phosphate phosphodiesterase
LILKFLGTGTSQGIPVIGCDCNTCTSKNTHNKRLRSSAYIVNGNDKILIDCGPDLRQQFLTNNIDDLDAIIVTHEHNDHTAGLDDIRPINFRHNKSIPLFTNKRVKDDLAKRYEYVFLSNPYPGSPKIELNEIEFYESFNIGETKILPLKVQHGELEIIGIRINNMAYLTDVSALDFSTLQHLKELDVLVISALQRASHHAHLCFEDAINLARKIGAKNTYLIHMSHTLGDVEEWSKELDSNIHYAYDGLELEM